MNPGGWIPIFHIPGELQAETVIAPCHFLAAQICLPFPGFRTHTVLCAAVSGNTPGCVVTFFMHCFSLPSLATVLKTLDREIDIKHSCRNSTSNCSSRFTFYQGIDTWCDYAQGLWLVQLCYTEWDAMLVLYCKQPIEVCICTKTVCTYSTETCCPLPQLRESEATSYMSSTFHHIWKWIILVFLACCFSHCRDKCLNLLSPWILAGFIYSGFWKKVH